MLVLAVDTSSDACQAALVDGDFVLAARSEPMSRGHQERLAPMVEAVMGEAKRTFAEVDRIAVTTGPGSFTGLRVGLAFATGLGMALNRPALGFATLEALAASGPNAGLVAAAIDARRGDVYLQLFQDGAPVAPPEAVGLEAAAGRIEVLGGGSPGRLVGSGAPLLSKAIPGAAVDARGWAAPEALARLAAAADPVRRPLTPTYLRSPDAKLPGGVDPWARA